MQNAQTFRDKIAAGHTCLGAFITTTDPTITEALCGVSDFVWVDMEHNAMSLETVQGHLMATKGSDTATLVRVLWNDMALIKPVLDIGADGVIVPWVRTAEDVRQAVAACRYPPEGLRGYGPRRASGYGKIGPQEFCQLANRTVIIVVQVEHVDAVRNLDEILAVPGLTSIVIGPNDLAGSMGYMGQPAHPEVVGVMESILAKARQTSVWASISVSGGPEVQAKWARSGAQWLPIGGDIGYMLGMARQSGGRLRELLAAPQGEQP
jgi:2-dehydro-3-deoxyglucarate aldolase/4-hydroxy-2-oxoheptanedioate aldolase